MRKKRELPDVEPVELKPIFGIRPGIVILSSIVLFILIVFFLLFMLPGIVKGGKYVSFESELTNVGIYLDEQYLGSSRGSRYFISSGEHDVRYVKDALTIGEGTIDISHPIFFTLFFHRGEDIKIEYVKSEELVKAINDNFLKEVSSWSKVTSFNSVTTLPPLFSDYAIDMTALGENMDWKVWNTALMHISSSEMYQDYLKACSILSIESTLDGDIFTSDDNASFDYTHDPVIPCSSDDGFISYAADEFQMGSYLGSNYPLTNEKRVEASVPDFSIASRPVSEYEYALFLSENPKWALRNKDELMKEGLVDENYLSGVSISIGFVSNRPVRNISYHAACAYIDWLSGKDGISYRLPTEEEWSYAAYSVQDKSYATSLNWTDMDDTRPKMMMGGIWEFTSTEYVPLSRVLSYDTYPVENDDVIIKGGSYLNTPESVNADTVGLIGKSTCSDYVGFRIVK